MAKRVLNLAEEDEETKQLLSEDVAETGKPIEDFILVFDDETGDKEYRHKAAASGLGAFAAGAAEAIGPSLLGTGTGRLGQVLAGTRLGARFGVPGAIVGAVGGGLLGSYLQEKVASKISPDMMREAEILRESRPILSTLGSMAGGFSAGANLPRTLLDTAKRQGGSTAGNILKAAAAPAALSAGVEAGQEAVIEGELDPMRIGMAGLIGPLQVKPTRAGRLAERIGERVADSIAPTPPPRIRPARDIYRDVIDLQDAGIADETVYKKLAEEAGAPEASVDQLISMAEKATEGYRLQDSAVREQLGRKTWQYLEGGGDPSQLPQDQLSQYLLKEYKAGALRDEEQFARVAKSRNPELIANRLREENLKPNLNDQKQAQRTLVEVLNYHTPPEVRDAVVQDVRETAAKLNAEAKELKKRLRMLRGSSDLETKNNIIVALAENRNNQRKLTDYLGFGTSKKIASAQDTLTFDKLVKDEPDGEDIEAVAEKAIKAAEAAKPAEKVPPSKPASAPPPAGDIVKEAVTAKQNAEKEKTSKESVLTTKDAVVGDTAASAPTPPPPPVEATPTAPIISKALQLRDGRIVLYDGLTFPPGIQSQDVHAAGFSDGKGGFVAEDPTKVAHEAEKDKILAEKPKPVQEKPVKEKKAAPEKEKKVSKKGAELPAGVKIISAEGTKPKPRKDDSADIANQAAKAKAATDPNVAPEDRSKWMFQDSAQRWYFKKGAPMKIQQPDGSVVTGTFKGYPWGDKAAAPDYSKVTIESKDGEITAPAELAGIDSSTPASKQFGVTPEIGRDAIRLALALPDQLISFIHTGRAFGKQVWSGTKGVVDHIRDLGRSGEYLADKDFALHRDATRTMNVAWLHYNNAFKGLSKQEIGRINQYLNERQLYGDSIVNPSGRELAAINQIRNGLIFLGTDQIIRGGPGIRQGSHTRTRGIDPDYLPSMVNPKVNEILHSAKPDSAEYQNLKRDWVSHYMAELDVSEADAAKMFDDFIKGTGEVLPQNASKFSAVTTAEGVGLPMSWRAPLKETLYWHAYRAAKNLAWFTHVQSDPKLARIVGEVDDGWDGEITKDVKWDDGVDVDTLSNNNMVKEWLLDYNAHKSHQPNILDKLTQLKNSLTIGVKSAFRDFVATPGHLYEIMDPDEVGGFLEAAKSIMRAGNVSAEKAGAMRAFRPLNFENQLDVFGAIDRVAEAGRKFSGRNLIERKARQFAFEVGRYVSDARLHKGDMEFFEKLKIPDWRQLSPEGLRDAVGAKFVEYAQGNYRASGLPTWLLNTSQKGSGFLRSVLTLSRWGVERFNNWHKRAWEPAVKEGKLGPLFKSVLGNLATASLIRLGEEWLFNAKPPEMTWSEFMKADDKELPYTMFSKLQNAGFAGILSSLAFDVTKLASGENPRNSEYPGWALMQSAVTRTVQALDAVGKKGADGLDVLFEFPLTLARDNIQWFKIMDKWSETDKGKREDHMFKRQTGELKLRAGSSFMNNPFDPHADLRKAETREEAEKALPRSARAIAETGEVPIIRADQPDPTFYPWLSKIQSPDAAKGRLSADLARAGLTREKRLAVRRIGIESGALPR